MIKLHKLSANLKGKKIGSPYVSQCARAVVQQRYIQQCNIFLMKNYFDLLIQNLEKLAPIDADVICPLY